VKALLIDDHAIARSSLIRLLADVRKFTILEAASGREAIAVQKKDGPGFIILDLELPDISGIDLLRYLVQADKTAKILVCSMHDDVAYISLCLKLGAKGYVSKNVSPDELKNAIGEVLGGRSYVESEISAQLRDPLKHRSMELSEREVEFLRLLAKGQSYAEIADSWGLSYKTVANTAGQIRSRLNLSSMFELIVFAAKLYGRNQNKS
jgi:two-component system, NarL family, invasion response regulator UvrY